MKRAIALFVGLCAVSLLIFLSMAQQRKSKASLMFKGVEVRLTVIEPDGSEHTEIFDGTTAGSDEFISRMRSINESDVKLFSFDGEFGPDIKGQVRLTLQKK